MSVGWQFVQEGRDREDNGQGGVYISMDILRIFEVRKEGCG